MTEASYPRFWDCKLVGVGVEEGTTHGTGDGGFVTKIYIFIYLPGDSTSTTKHTIYTN